MHLNHYLFIRIAVNNSDFSASSGYALSDVFGWNEGLSKTFRQAKGFYTIIAASTLIGLCINFTSTDPIKGVHQKKP